jgi:hypothetical protein
MNWHNKVFVFDDIVNLETQNHIKDLMLNKAMWSFVSDVTNPKENTQQRPGFAHWFVADEIIKSDLHDEVKPIIENSLKKLQVSGEKRYLQGRSFLQLPLNISDREKLDVPHIDLANFKHLVILYYVTDADGETVIYDNQFKDGEPIPNFSELKEKQRVMPKQGRVICFDGYYWHTSQQPSKGTRCIINYNVV